MFFQVNVTHNVDANTQYAKINANSLVNLGPIALFSEAKLTFSDNRLEKAKNLHTASLKHKVLSSSPATTDLLYGSEKNYDRRGDEITNNKKALQKRTFPLE